MKFIEENFSVIENPDIALNASLMRYICDVGDLMYKRSKHEKSDDDKFVSDILKVVYSYKRNCILDHVILTFEISSEIYNDFIKYKNSINSNPYSNEYIRYYTNSIHITKSESRSSGHLIAKPLYIISGSVKAFHTIWIFSTFSPNSKFSLLLRWISYYYPTLMRNTKDKNIDGIALSKYTGNGIKRITNSDMEKYNRAIRLEHEWMTIRLTMSSDSIDHIYRYKPLYATISEATEYDHHKDNELQFIIPPYLSDSDKNNLIEINYSDETIDDIIKNNSFKLHRPALKFLKLCNKSSKYYHQYIEEYGIGEYYGGDPMMCKEILPHSLSRSIVITMNLNQWDNFLCRYNNDCKHVTISPITKEIFDYLVKLKPEIYKI